MGVCSSTPTSLKGIPNSPRTDARIQTSDPESEESLEFQSIHDAIQSNAVYELNVPEGCYPTVIREVVDGDTVDCVIKLHGSCFVFRGRLSGINCPESRTRDLDEKVHGIACKLFLKRLLEDQTLYVVITQRDSEGEKFGRILMSLRFGNENVNDIMLKRTPTEEYHGEKKKKFDAERANACQDPVYLECLEEAHSIMATSAKKPRSTK